jgi:predicted Zn-dependent protease
LLAARVARRGGAWADADSLLDRYWALYGDDEEIVSERLFLRAARGEVEATGPQLVARARQGGPDAALAREALITGFLYRFLWEEGNRQLDDWFATAPDNTTALLLRGKIQEQRLQTSAAANSFRRVLELDPDHDEARLRLTTLLLQLRQGDEAVPHLQYLRGRLPDHPEVAVQLARGLALQGRTEESRVALDEALRAHPDYPAALADRGKTAAADGDDRAAEEYFARAVRLDPGDLPTRHQYVLTLSRLGKATEAAAEQDAAKRLEADLERINALIQGPLQRTPNDPAIHHEIATIALRAGQPTDALRWLRSALQVAPDHLPAHQTLAAFYHQTGSPALAAKHRAIAHHLETGPGK